MKELREKRRTLSQWSMAITGSDGARLRCGAAASSSADGDRDMYNDLNKKLGYLNIAIDSDKAEQGDYFAILEMPLYPNAPVSSARYPICRSPRSGRRPVRFALHRRRAGIDFDRAALRHRNAGACSCRCRSLGKIPVVRWASSPHKPAARG